MEEKQKQERSKMGMKYITKEGVDGVPEGCVGYVYFEYPDYKKPHKLGIGIIFENGIYEEFDFGIRNRYLKQDKKYKSYSKYDFTNVSKLMEDYNKKFWKF